MWKPQCVFRNLFAIVSCESGKIFVFLQRTDIKTTKKSVFPIVLRHS